MSRSHSESPKPPGEPVTPPPATPGEDVNLTAIVRFAVGLAVVGACVSASVFGLMRVLARLEAKEDAVVAPLAQHDVGRPPTGVRLQEQPFRLLEDLRAEARTRLTSYGWIDEKGGVARIPIDEAMRLVVRHGLPVRGASPRSDGPTAAATPAPASTAVAAAPVKPAAPASAKPRPQPKPTASTEAAVPESKPAPRAGENP